MKLDFQKQHFQLVLFSLLWQVITYMLPNRFLLREPWAVPTTLVDNLIPVSSHWIWIYVSFYVFIASAYFFSKDLFDRQLIFYSYVGSATFSFFYFFLFPSAIDRAPYLIKTGGPSDFLLNLIRTTDASVNCFPSMHICLSTVAAMTIYKSSKKWGAFAVFWLVMIAYSTMATKQHYFYDVISGAGLGMVTWYGVFTLLRRQDAQRAAGSLQ
jgi:membrane-associated phospholipid phosphatase